MKITKKELQFIDLWASKIPMPGEEYCLSVMEDIKECYETYKEKYQNKEYTLIFSNGEEINFEILAGNLCHMLGIDYKNLKDDFFKDYRRDVLNLESTNFSSFDLLESILEHSIRVVELDNDPNNKCKVLNYYKSQIKCNIFRKISDFSRFDFAAINYQLPDGKHDYDNQKLLFLPSNETLFPYFMMGIKASNPEQEDDVLKKYIVSTLLAPKDPKTYFEGQEVIIPTQLLISDNFKLTKVIASAEDKIKLLTMYKAIINEFGIASKLNISGDYESLLNYIVSLGNKKKALK